MIFVDSSAYLGLLMPQDVHRKRAEEISSTVFALETQLVTSFAVLGEVLTIGSMRFKRSITIEFVNKILNSKTTTVIEENQNLRQKALVIFTNIQQKDVGWVDCLSFAIIEEYKIPKVFSFDKDFRAYAKTTVIF